MSRELETKIRSMKFEFTMREGKPPDTLLLPRNKEVVKLFVEQFVDENGEENTGSKPFVFHCLMTGEQTLEYCDLRVELHDDERIGMQ